MRSIQKDPTKNTISVKDFQRKTLKIQKNSEKQTEIVRYLDNLEAKKNSIDEEISDIDTLMKQVLEQSYNLG